jgi:hypothetical protein
MPFDVLLVPLHTRNGRYLHGELNMLDPDGMSPLQPSMSHARIRRTTCWTGAKGAPCRARRFVDKCARIFGASQGATERS